MLCASYASLWHWMQRTDCSPSKLSVAEWQLSRVHVLLGNAQAAEHHAKRCLEHAEQPGVARFFLAYAAEALARAALLAGEHSAVEEHLSRARAIAAELEKEEERRALLADLETIERPGA